MNNKQCVKQEIYLVYWFEGGLDIAAKLLPGHLATETSYLIFNNVLQMSELPPRKKKEKGLRSGRAEYSTIECKFIIMKGLRFNVLEISKIGS